MKYRNTILNDDDIFFLDSVIKHSNLDPKNILLLLKKAKAIEEETDRDIEYINRLSRCIKFIEEVKSGK